MGLEANIRHVTPYVPGEQPRQKVIKLNTNENPYPPAPGAMEMLHQMDPEKLRMYPDPEIKMLTECLASRYQVRPEQVFVGVGSDDVLAMSFLTFFNSGKPVLFPDITYSFYKVWAELYRVPYTCPSLDGTMHIRAEDYCGENGGIILANPNAPTGLYESLDVIEKILKENPGVVVIVDEAYIDFAGPSARELLSGYDNLLVVQTFSKSRSMAGVRIGFALGSPALIKALNDVKYSYNSYTMNLPSQIAGTQAVKDRAYFEETRAKIMATRERSKKRFAELGFTFPDSMTNFILVTHERVPARAIFDALKKEQIYVRYFNAPRLDNSLRVSIGTDEEMDVLFRFLEQYLKEWKPAGDSE